MLPSQDRRDRGGQLSWLDRLCEMQPEAGQEGRAVVAEANAVSAMVHQAFFAAMRTEIAY